MERLGHLISEAVNSGEWKPISMGRGGPGITYHFRLIAGEREALSGEATKAD